MVFQFVERGCLTTTREWVRIKDESIVGVVRVHCFRPPVHREFGVAMWAADSFEVRAGINESNVTKDLGRDLIRVRKRRTKELLGFVDAFR
jgi:HD superfamily phosphohydrolase YqeK